MNRYFLFFILTFILSACKDKEEKKDVIVAVTGISIEPTNIEIQAGKNGLLTATITPENAGNKNIIWLSRDESIATIVDGLITAVSEGNTTITATTVDGAYAAESLVSVIEADDPIEPVYKYTYSFLGEDVMPIATWVCPDKKFITAEHTKNLAESGINSMYGHFHFIPLSDHLDEIHKSLDLFEANKMVYLVYDETPIENASYYDDIKSHPAFGGVKICDEPGTAMYDNLQALKKQFDPIFPGKLFYINMLSDASQSTLVNGAVGGNVVDESVDYEKYINLYLEKIRPEVLSYDYYPMSGVFPRISSRYFKQMSYIAEKANQANIPFWVFIQACSWQDNVRICTLPEILWQVNTALCYGCKGIQYFSYWTYFDQRTNDQVGAMISRTGEKQPMYFHVQTANKQVNAISKVLINSVFKGIIKKGFLPYNIQDGDLPTKDLITEYKVLASVSGDPSLVGCFNHLGKPAYYVVNNSVIKNDASIKLTFKRGIDFDVTIDGVTESKSGGNITLTLSAGNAALITVK